MGPPDLLLLRLYCDRHKGPGEGSQLTPQIWVLHWGIHIRALVMTLNCHLTPDD